MSTDSAKPQTGVLRAQWWQMGLVLLPAVFAYGIMAWLVTRTPVLDDFDHIFRFAVEYTLAPTASAKFSVLANTQIGPYKLVFDHILVILQLAVLGHLDFPLMILLGNLTLVGIFALLARNTLGDRFPAQHRILLLVPVSLLFFGLNYAETVDWAISGLQQPAVVLFALLSVHWLVRPGRRMADIALASMAGLLASATYANGMILWPIGFFFLLLPNSSPDRGRGHRLAKLSIWFAGFAMSSGIYFYHYRTDGLVVPATLFAKAAFFVAFCGGAMENMHHRPVPHISLLIGTAALLTFGHALWTRYDRRNPFFVYSVVWVLLTGVVVSNARIGMGMVLSLSSRYKMYSDLLLIFCYEYLLDRLLRPGMPAAHAARVRYALAASFVIAVAVNAGADAAGAHLLSVRRHQVDSAMTRYIDSHGAESPVYLLDGSIGMADIAERARQTANEAVRLGIYRPVRP